MHRRWLDRTICTDSQSFETSSVRVRISGASLIAISAPTSITATASILRENIMNPICDRNDRRRKYAAVSLFGENTQLKKSCQGSSRWAVLNCRLGISVERAFRRMPSRLSWQTPAPSRDDIPVSALRWSAVWPYWPPNRQSVLQSHPSKRLPPSEHLHP